VPLAAIIGYLLFAGLLARWGMENYHHRKRLRGLDLRIHVNGIRGKSTVTRIIAGLLREAGCVTVAKSTGTFAAVINRDGVDEPIHRNGPATILEQINVIRDNVTPDVKALVIECMALRPQYQEVSERMIVRSNIGVLTNVREDHQDVMGETLPEIAASLLSTCPRKGVLITGERNPEILKVINYIAGKRRTMVIEADPEWVSDEDLEKFDYIAFKENVAIGLAVADLAGIPRDLAMRGMIRAEPDPGVLRMKELSILGKRVTWANLFAVNDRESMSVAMEKLVPFMTPETTTVGILNNRADRERRAVQFADVAVEDLDFNYLVTFGAFEGLVTDRLVQNGYPLNHILNLGDTHSPPVETIVQRMIGDMPTSHVLVVGFVNIHTHQAEMMLEYFEHEAQPWSAVEAPSAEPSRTEEAHAHA
jgi:poly-gamma-glutamate synthase PgsB/CapB